MVAGYLLAAWSIGHLELSLVEPLLTTYLVWALILAVPMSRQSVKVGEVIGALILCSGVALLSVRRSITPIGFSSARSRTGRPRSSRASRASRCRSGTAGRARSGPPSPAWGPAWSSASRTR